MDCKDVKNLISLYVDGELDSKESLEMVEHLSRCESCYISVRGERFVKRLLRSSVVLSEPPLHLVAGIEGLYEERVRILPLIFRFIPAFLLLLFLLFALIYKMREQRLDDRIFGNISNPPLTASIEDVNRFFSTFGSTKNNLKLNGNNRSDVNFIGMRFNRVDDGEAAHIYYTYRGKHVSFFAVKGGSIADKMRFIPASYYKNNSYVVKRGRQNLLLVSENDITFALAGDAEADELYEILSDLR